MKWATVVAAILLGGCATLSNKIALAEEEQSSKACIAAGYTMIHPQYADCVTNTTAQRREQQRAEAQGDILGFAAIAGASYAAAKSPPSYVASGGRQAPLVGQTYANFQRTCTYQTPSGAVSLVTAGGQSCPATYTY